MLRYRRILAMCAALAVLTAGCGQPSQAVDAAPAALAVRVQTPQRGSLSQVAAYTGRIMPEESVYIIPKIPGEITAIYYDVGDTITAGEVLFEVDATEVELAVRQAEAGVQAVSATIAATMGSGYESQLLQAESALKQAQSAEKWTSRSYDDYDDTFNASTNTLRNAVNQTRKGVTALQTVYTTVRKLASLDSGGRIPLPREVVEALVTLNRSGLTEVVPDGNGTIDAGSVYILEGEYTEAKATLTALERQYKDASNSYDAQQTQLNQGLESVEIGLDVSEKAYNLVASGRALNEQLAVYAAQLDQARLGYEAAMHKLTYTRVTSPISGVIEQKNITLNGMAGQSTPAFVVSNKGSLTVNFNVPATAIHALEPGDVVSIEAGGRTYEARVTEIANAINQQSGLFPIKAQIGGDTSGLLTGMAVKLTAATAKAENALLIPISTIYYDDGKPYVYVVRDGQAVKTPIETGILSNEQAEVLSGLDASMQVVATWSPNLNDGVSIQVGQEG